jgi:hypothetical protein
LSRGWGRDSAQKRVGRGRETRGPGFRARLSPEGQIKVFEHQTAFITSMSAVAVSNLASLWVKRSFLVDSTLLESNGAVRVAAPVPSLKEYERDHSGP